MDKEFITEVKEKIKELKNKNIPIYSISKLGTLEECYYEYYLTYIKKLPSINGIYGYMGSKVHSVLENIQNGIIMDFTKEIQNALVDAKILGLNFPTENIKDKWIKNILTFSQDYIKPIYNKVETEKLFLFERDGKYIQGIIDLIIYNEDGTISIRDYKTSGKFSNADLPIKGRQLILYGLAMEQQGYKVKDLAWEMLKYVQISYKLKNGNTRTTIAERGYIVEKLEKDIQKTLESSKQYTSFEIEEMIYKGIQTNSLLEFPKFIQDKYTIENYTVFYDFSDINKTDTCMYIEAKIGEIECFQNKEDYWDAKDIMPNNEFYCLQLCGQRENCKYLTEYKKRKEFYENLDKEEQMEKEFEELSKFI